MFTFFLYTYVGGNPVSYSDPLGLDPWFREAWTPARVFTDMTEGATIYFDPMSRDLLVIPTRNAVTSRSDPGAAGPYSAHFTFCQYPNSLEFGTAKWRTTDARLRWVHGGGTRLGDPGALLPRQGWVPTQECTRAQNEDVEALCKISEEWERRNPGQRIPHSRW